jgi:hypothetical protein
MRPRRIVFMCLLILAAACAEPAAGEPEGTTLRYSYPAGETLSYELVLGVEMTSRAAEPNTALGNVDWAMTMELTERLDLAFAEGEDPATIRITMTQEVLDGEARVTSLGQEQSIPLDQVTAGLENEVVVVVDPQGRLLSASIGGSQLPAQLLAALSGFSGSTLLQPQQLGPEFPDQPLAVGDEWETSASAELLGLTITQTSHHRVAAREELLGNSTYRIESRITTGPYASNLASLLAELRANPGLLGGGDAAQLDDALAQFAAQGIDAEFAMAESTASLTTWFDPGEGRVVRSELSAPTSLSMALGGIPGAGDGTMQIEMSTRQRMTLTG